MPQWIKLKLIERPYYDKNGNLIDRPLKTDSSGLAEIYGGGKVYPDIANQKDKILEWHEKGADLLLQIEITDAEAAELETRDEALKYQASPKVVISYNHKDFNFRVLTKKEAEIMKKDVSCFVPVE